MAKNAPEYPFVPLSNRRLAPGQFWGVLLKDGRFACGRVLQVDQKTRVMFVAGLMDWIGPERPTAKALSGSHILEIGQAHVKTIRETGGQVDGFRPLEVDSLEVPERSDPGGWVVRGYEYVRQSDRHELARMKPFSTWGFE